MESYKILHPRNTHEKNILDLRNTHEKFFFWTHKIPTRKYFGHRKYLREKISDPRMQDDTVEQDAREFNTLKVFQSVWIAHLTAKSNNTTVI